VTAVASSQNSGVDCKRGFRHEQQTGGAKKETVKKRIESKKKKDETP